MQLTKEQEFIVRSTGDLRINAVAGSGKTTTVIAYAGQKSSSCKILYLAFNKSVKLEARRRFEEQGLTNVRVETAHSLAFRHIIPGYGYRLASNGYSIFDIAQLLEIESYGEKHQEYVIASHVQRFMTYFCNSAASKVRELDYASVVSDSKARQFVINYYDYIEKKTRRLLARMDRGEVDIIHDFYLKKFQLSQPALPFDCILFDEGQDASAAMLDIFRRQRAEKVIVGDTHQQIYGWRYAVNSLEKMEVPSRQLTTSFRFGQEIANLAMYVLSWKGMIMDYQPQQITGSGKSGEVETKAVIGRTNLGLLLHAIEQVTDEDPVASLYFEGNINSYTYAEDGASLYDVLSLYNGYHDKIRDRLIRQMRSIGELEEYVEKTEDAQLKMMLEIVMEYGNEIPGIIQTIKDLHVEDGQREKAELIFSTVHKSKGMEYDRVQLIEDFINEQSVRRLAEDKEQDDREINKMIEEINLLYVAVTRARSMLLIPESLVPEDFRPSTDVIILRKEASDEELDEDKQPLDYREPARQINLSEIMEDLPALGEKTEKAYSVEKVRKSHRSAYKSWTQEEET